MQSSGGRAACHNSGTPTHLHPLFTSLAPSPNRSACRAHPLCRHPLVLPIPITIPLSTVPCPTPLGRRFFWLSFISHANLTPAPTETLSYLTMCASADELRLIYLELVGSGCTHKRTSRGPPSLCGFTIYSSTSPCLRRRPRVLGDARTHLAIETLTKSGRALPFWIYTPELEEEETCDCEFLLSLLSFLFF